MIELLIKGIGEYRVSLTSFTGNYFRFSNTNLLIQWFDTDEGIWYRHSHAGISFF